MSDDVFHLFANNIQFFDVEMDFEKSSRAVRTLYFLKEEHQWKPAHVVQFEGGLSDLDGITDAILNSNYTELKSTPKSDLLIELSGQVKVGTYTSSPTSSFIESTTGFLDSGPLSDPSSSATLLITSGSLKLHSSLVDEAYEGTITSKEQWESWDKYIDILVQTDSSM